MNELLTKYGIIKGISSAEFYPDNKIKECKLNMYNEIITPFGKMIPLYEDNGVRCKYISSLKFYENGNLRSISLQKPCSIKTSMGELPAELILFYENGNVKRIFPLNGKITAYWTEDNEYDLAEEFEFNFQFGNFKKKIINIKFFETGNIKSITFWQKDSITINTPIGIAEARIGISLYESGKIKSLEPAKPLQLMTPIGLITAFDTKAVGINGDENSLSFNENGDVSSLITSANRIEVSDDKGNISTFCPQLKPSLLNPNVMEVVPLKIQFTVDKALFIINNEKNEFTVKNHKFHISNFSRKIQN